MRLRWVQPHDKLLTRVCNSRWVEVFTLILTFPHQGLTRVGKACAKQV